MPKEGKRSSGSQRKHQISPAYVRLAQEMRMALRKGWPEYAGVLEKRAAKPRSKLHGVVGS